MRLDRLLIEKIENRILVGIAAFVGTMVIVGWIGINEPARMAVFTDQYHGRSVERGAYLFNQNCSECHGIDGRGLVGIAPGLNNPHMFGYDFTAAIDREMGALQRELDAGVTEERQAEIEARMAELEAELDDLIAQMQPAIDSGYPVDTPERMDQVAWEGSVRSYVLTTLVHGRPGSVNYWPQPMAAWGQTAGGPLREDQLEDLTNYIMNWDKGEAWTIDDLNAVSQFAKLPADPALAVAGAGESTVGTDVDTILTELEGYTGDPVNGQALYNGGTYACAGCHMNAAVAPPTEEQWAAVTTGAGGRPYADEPMRYFVESIVLPNDYVVEGYPANAMPQNFGERMSYQDMADILAYIESYDS